MTGQVDGIGRNGDEIKFIVHYEKEFEYVDWIYFPNQGTAAPLRVLKGRDSISLDASLIGMRNNAVRAD